MNFALSDDQEALRDAARDVLAKDATWASLDEMGVFGLLVPEAGGGLGLDETYLAPILEEAGRVAFGGPIVETAMVAAPLIGLGHGVATTDLGGPNVAWAADADALLLRDGDGLRLFGPGDVVLDALDTVDVTRRAARVVSARRGEPVAGDVARACDRGALGTAAILVGLAQAMLDMTVAYVTERRQFGQPVGSFQAVKHHLADARLAIEFARPVVWRAAWSVARDTDDRARDVSTAKAMASEAAELVGRKALQCHGAIGYTVEYDLHLFLKRTWALSRAWGDAAQHADRVAAALTLS
ncbi:MAG TPA: acyl-CoA dehydrogenase [Acidimicrobiales bacterium]|nr:acyl-CoA dehydrogenase [Acidimicrobiales bacterium]